MKKFTYLDYFKYTRETKLNSMFVLREDSAEYKLEKIHQPQDKGYKIVFDNKQEAVKFINKVLGLENTINELKGGEIEICNTNFITTNFKEKRADIIYKKKDENIFFLIEHQSKIDYSMAYRIFEYSAEIIKKTVIEKLLKNKNYKIPVVYPIVLYTGKKKWNAKKYLEECQEKLKGVKGATFTSYNLVDVNNYTEEELWKENTLLSKMLLLEKAKKQKNITEYLQKVIKQKIKKEEMHLLMEMVYNSKDIDFKEIKQIVEKLKNEKGDELAMLTPLQEYVEGLLKEEHKIGRSEGDRKRLIKDVKNMLKSNINEKVIKQIAEISQKELEEIKQM